MITSIVIIARAFPEMDDYYIVKDFDEPRCAECITRPMEKLGTLLYQDRGRAGNRWERQELWRCPHCGYEDHYFPGMYGEDEFRVTLDEYLDHQGHEKQTANLFARYGTSRPTSIRDYWMKS